MLTVEAKRDLRSMSDVSRFRPRLVLCMPREGGLGQGEQYVVKYRQGKVFACGLVSEVVGGLLLKAAGLRVVVATKVAATAYFSYDCERKEKDKIPYRVTPGHHFGTPYIRGEPGPVIKLAKLTTPQDVVDLWVMDCWLCTTDRYNEGNTLLVPNITGRLDLYAVDQSDCLSGCGNMSDGTWTRVLSMNKPVENAGCLSEAVYSRGGPASIKHALDCADKARPHLDESIAQVPGEWLEEAGIRPEEVAIALDTRYRNLRNIVDVDSWPRPSGEAHLF